MLLKTTPELDAEQATVQLRNQFNGPYHGSVMFRTESYQSVGGYRVPFRYAQDWDLWLRLSEVGQIQFAPEALYAFRFSSGSISSFRREQQRRLVEIARKCSAARASGRTEEELLQEASHVSAEPAVQGAVVDAGNAYFVGKCLLDRRDRRALPYLWQSVQHAPENGDPGQP